MSKLILLRHGQSEWNQLNRFTGWVDVGLSARGVQEALDAGKKIQNLPIDQVFTSSLLRAQVTAMLAMQGHISKKPLLMQHPQGKMKEWGADHCTKDALKKCIPTIVSENLNERYYGDLQGMDKDEARSQFGVEQVHIWRRSYDVPPPNGESLKMTLERTLPYFKKEITPLLDQGKNILIAAHGNSLRAISMYIQNLNEEEIVKLEIPTGVPLVYNCLNQKFELVND